MLFPIISILEAFCFKQRKYIKAYTIAGTITSIVIIVFAIWGNSVSSFEIYCVDHWNPIVTYHECDLTLYQYGYKYTLPSLIAIIGTYYYSFCNNYINTYLVLWSFMFHVLRISHYKNLYRMFYNYKV